MRICDPNLSRAATLISLGRLADAEGMLRSSLAADPESADALRLLSTCLRLQERSAEAVEAARRALALAADDVDVHACMALALHADRRYEEALVHGREAARLGSHDVVAVFALATVAIEIDLDEAERAAVAVQRMAPFSPSGHHLRARIEMTRGRWTEAERWSRQSLRCDPVSAAEHNNLAVILQRQGRLEEAAAQQHEAVRLDPRRDLARRNLHQALRVGEERGGSGLDLPFDAADVAGTLDASDRASSLVGVIQAALRDGRMAQARAAADEAWSLVRSLPLDTPRQRLVRVLVVAAIGSVELRGQPEATLQALLPVHDDAMELLTPTGRRSWLNNLGVARMRTGDTAGAVQSFTELVELERTSTNPDSLGRALLNLGAAHAEHGDDAGAERAYRECRALADANGHVLRAATVRANLARAELRAGRPAEAAMLVEEAIGMLDRDDTAMLLATCQVVRGCVALRHDDLDGARRILLTALQRFRRAGDRRVADGYSYLAEIAARQGRPGVALLHLRRAEARALTAGTRRTAAEARAVVERCTAGAGAVAAP